MCDWHLWHSWGRWINRGLYHQERICTRCGKRQMRNLWAW